MKELPKRNPAVRWVALGFVILGLAAFASMYFAQKSMEQKPRHLHGYTPWTKETLKVAESIPLMDGGRVKPLSTYAGFAMYQIHGDRSMKIEIDSTEKDAKKPLKVIKLKPTDWILDCLFRPELAIDLPTFRIDNKDVVSGIGLTPGEKRDRYSYRELEPGREKLIELAKTYEAVASEKRDPQQQQTIDLAYNLRKFEGLIGYMTFARGVTLQEQNGTRRADISVVMGAAPMIRETLDKAQKEGTEIPVHVKALLEQVLDSANFAKNGIALFPAIDPAKNPEWTTAGNEIMSAMTQSGDPVKAIGNIKSLEKVAHALPSGQDAFRAELSKFRDEVIAVAKPRGEYRAVELEASYYRQDWFLNALVYFLLGSLLAGGMWVAGRNTAGKVLAWASGLSTVAGAVYCIIAIGQRCYIMSRPPVGNLYDTIIFIGTTIVVLSLIVELLTRKRFALGLAPIIGASLVLLARLYEVGDAKDHMDPLVAVLRSNYWLTIHVITITLGYTAGLLTALISHIYLFLRATRLDEGDRSLQRTLTRAAYGCVCFTLFLSLIGTVLGGIWANDSWGRFWGWDPKENGALLIVLWNLAILHARLGGYLKEWSFHIACVLGSCVVVFSWWHVNFFNTGLHNYGFTSGKSIIWGWYQLELGYVILATIAWVVWSRIEQKQKLSLAKPSV